MPTLPKIKSNSRFERNRDYKSECCGLVHNTSNIVLQLLDTLSCLRAGEVDDWMHESILFPEFLKFLLVPHPLVAFSEYHHVLLLHLVEVLAKGFITLFESML